MGSFYNPILYQIQGFRSRIQQSFHLPPQIGIGAAGLSEKRGTGFGDQLKTLMKEIFNNLPAFRRVKCSAHSGCSARQFKVQPRFGQSEFTMDGGSRDVQSGGSFVIGEAPEVQQLDQLALALILHREAL